MATPDLEVEQDFGRMWDDAQKSFKKRTKKSLRDSKTQSLDDVLEELEKRFNENDPTNGSKQKRVKEAISNVLKIIQLLGGIAAQGACVVFGPANLCFNAVQFLINVPGKISRFYDAFRVLFEKILMFMQQFKIYRRIEEITSLGFELKMSTHKLMVVFVEACAISIDVLNGSTWALMKTAAKSVLFDKDTGLHVTLEKFQRLLNENSQIRDTITLEQVMVSERDLHKALNEAAEESRKLLEVQKDTDKDVRILKEAVVPYVNEQLEKGEWQMLLKRIARALVLPEKLLDPRNALEQLKIESVENTGQWLSDVEEYREWADLEGEANPILLLIGGSGSGKSHIVSAILREVRSRDKSKNMIFHACYSFDEDDKPPQNSSIKRAPKLALNSLALQIAQQSFVYAQALSSYFNLEYSSVPRNLTTRDLAQKLFPPPRPERKPATAYVLILDGVNQLSTEEAFELFDAIHAIRSPQIRIIITATGNRFHDWSGIFGTSSKSVPRFQIEDFNRADIELFIDHELKSQKALKENSAAISNITNSIRKMVPEIAKGNFSNVKRVIASVIEAIELDCSEEKVVKLISATTLVREDEIAEIVIRDLTDSISVNEAEQLNEILVWSVYAMKAMSPVEMQAALFLYRKRASLQSLETKINDKYAKILDIRNNMVLVKPQIQNYFRNTTRAMEEDVSERNSEPIISMTITVQNTKLSKAHQFFWDLCEKITFKEWPFSNFALDAGARTRITNNGTEANLTLTRRCFELLGDDPKENIKILSQYALRNLLEHLRIMRRSVDQGKIKPMEREEIGAKLIDLLQSANRIEKHLDIAGFDSDFRVWLDEDLGLQTIQQWLGDYFAKQTFIWHEHSWPSAVVTGEKTMALGHVANMIARRWLCHWEWSAPLLYEWIEKFLDLKASEEKKAPMGDESRVAPVNKSDLGENVTIITLARAKLRGPSSYQTRILRAAGWAEKELKISGKSSLWHERIGLTYLRYNRMEAAKASFLTAKTLPDCSWRVSWGLVKVYAIEDKVAMAAKEHEIVLEEDPRSGSYSSRTLRLRLECFMKPFKLIRTITKIIISFFRLFVETDQISETLEFLERMRLSSEKDQTYSLLESMLLEVSSKRNALFEAIFAATQDSGICADILGAIGRMLEVAENKKKKPNLIGLLLYHGVALARYRTSNGSIESALLKWRKCCELDLGSTCASMPDLVDLAARNIFNTYFSRLRSTTATRGDFEIYVTELNHLAERMRASWAPVGNAFRLSIGAFYTAMDKQDAAQQLLLSEMESTINTLYSSSSEHYVPHVATIANILMHAGDDLNALSAWSLLGPPDRYPE
ncbi:MAG: hypothetical protein Q9160_006727 [Pyrenula sp. 1 TL-2023]